MTTFLEPEVWAKILPDASPEAIERFDDKINKIFADRATTMWRRCVRDFLFFLAGIIIAGSVGYVAIDAITNTIVCVAPNSIDARL